MPRSTVLLLIVLFGTVTNSSAIAERICSAEAEVEKSAPLSTRSDSNQMIVLDVAAIELTLNRSDSSNEVAENKQQKAESEFHPMIGPNGKIVAQSKEELIESMKQVGTVRVLCDPTLATMDRHTATLTAGGLVKLDDRAKGAGEFIGTKLTVNPQIVTGKKLYIDLLLKCAELVERSDGEPEAEKDISSFEIDTTIEAEFGKTFVLGGITSTSRIGDQEETKELILLITPDIPEAGISSVDTSAAPSTATPRTVALPN